MVPERPAFTASTLTLRYSEDGGGQVREGGREGGIRCDERKRWIREGRKNEEKIRLKEDRQKYDVNNNKDSSWRGRQVEKWREGGAEQV